MSSLLRRLPLSRLLLLCSVVAGVAIGATALALAVGAGPTPPPKPLADAVHDALEAPKVEGVSARIVLTDHLLEGANLANNGGEASQLAGSPLISGASGRLWIGGGRARLELQSEKGDTQILYDGHTASLYDASTNTLYRYEPRSDEGEGRGAESNHGTPSVKQIEEAIAHASEHAQISGATPTDVAGQAAYTVRVAPRESGSLIAGAEVSWDAAHGTPLRAAVYSTDSSSPTIELAATEVSYGPVDSSTLEFVPPANAKVEEVKPPSSSGAEATSPGAGDESGTGSATSPPAQDGATDAGKPKLTFHGKGVDAIALLESPVEAGEGQSSASSQLESFQKVDIGGTSASELPTPLGTLLSFERAGVRYLLAGAVTPATIETFARGL